VIMDNLMGQYLLPKQSWRGYVGWLPLRSGWMGHIGRWDSQVEVAAT